MKARRAIVLGVAIVLAGVAALLVWSRRPAPHLASSRGGWLNPIPPMADPMPIQRPRPGGDTSMPIFRPDTGGRAHLPRSPR